MAKFWFLLLILPTLLSSSSSESSDLIRQTCKNTRYYDLCVSSLKSDTTSLRTDPKGLALIIVNLAQANATATNSYLISQVSNCTNTSDVYSKLMKECADKYEFAITALVNGARDLVVELYDLAYLHVMAAADYPSGCRHAFRECAGVSYPPELAMREDQLKQICDVALGIIDSLVNGGTLISLLFFYQISSSSSPYSLGAPTGRHQNLDDSFLSRSSGHHCHCRRISLGALSRSSNRQTPKSRRQLSLSELWPPLSPPPHLPRSSLSELQPAVFFFFLCLGGFYSTTASSVLSRSEYHEFVKTRS